MLEIKCFEFGPFGTNCFVVHDGGNVFLIDPACSNPREQQLLQDHIDSLCSTGKAQLTIIATHGHLDHLWGAAWATAQWSTPVRMHEADIPMVQDMPSQYRLFGIRATPQPFPIEPFDATFSSLHPQLSILHTPGHTPGSVCLYWQEEKTLVSGDTLFRMGYGRTDLPGGNMSRLITSLERLFTLPSDVKVYPGHGDFTTIGAEKR